MKQTCCDIRSFYGDNRARLCLRYLGREEHLLRTVKASELRFTLWQPDEDLSSNVYIRMIDSEQWDKLGASERLEWVKRVITSDALAVIFTDGTEPGGDLVSLFIEAGIPTFTSSMPAQRVYDELMFYKRAMLGESEVHHGVFLEIFGVGVLLQGESGVGKSELGLSLVARGHRLVADDAPEFWRNGDTLSGACPALLQDFLELRGLGFLDVRSLYGEGAIRLRKTLELVLRLEPMNTEQLRQITPDHIHNQNLDILGTRVPRFTLPVTAGRPMEILVENAVRVHVQRQRGYDANGIFMRRQHEMMNGNDDA